MGKTVGMITIYRKNYGAFLQAYALQQLLLSCGYEPEIIRYDYYKDKSVLGIPLANVKHPIRFAKQIAVEMLRYDSHKRKVKIFENSIQKHIRESKAYYSSYRQLEKNPPSYDLYLTGSDQVFNPALSPQALKARLLGFVKHGIRASYAASSGSNILSQKYMDLFVQNLRRFDGISVREEGLASFIQNILPVKTECHLDPTLVLDREDWKKFGQVPAAFCETKYILYYKVTNQQKLHDEAARLSKELGLPVLVADGTEKFENMLALDRILSPEEWVGLIDHAEYVVTNSFHGTAFAIKLNKRLRVVLPEAGKVRLETILEACGLMQLTDPQYIVDAGLEEVYSKANDFFAMEKQRSVAYLSGLCR